MLGGWRVLQLLVVGVIYTFFLKGSLVKVHKWRVDLVSTVVVLMLVSNEVIHYLPGYRL